MVKNEKLGNFREHQNIADVYVYGSSHAFCNMNAANLFEDAGITSVCVGQPEQPICMTYFQIKGDLQRYSPQLIIVELYSCIKTDEYNLSQVDSHYSRVFLSDYIWNNLSLRIEASRFFKDNRLEYILGFPVYHNQYGNLTYEGLPNTREMAGFNYWNQINYANLRNSTYSVKDIDASEMIPVSSITEEYLLKINELCKKRE